MPLTVPAQTLYDILISDGLPRVKGPIVGGPQNLTPTKIEGQTDPRPIAGSSSTSEHTYGNALDIYAAADVMAKIAEILHDNRSRYGIDVLCYDPGVGRKYDTCTTKHVDHIHVDFGPHCGGKIPTNVSAVERAKQCNDYQGGNPVEDKGIIGGAVDAALGPLIETIERGAIIALGAAIGIAAVVLIAKDTAVGKAAVNIATKGVVK